MENQKLAINFKHTVESTKEVMLPYYFKQGNDYYKLITKSEGENIMITENRCGIMHYSWQGHTTCSSYDKCTDSDSVEITADEYNSVRAQILLQLNISEA